MSFPPEAEWTRPAGGLFIWATLPDFIDTTDLLARALRDNVAFVPGAAAFLDGRPDQVQAQVRRLRDGATVALYDVTGVSALAVAPAAGAGAELVALNEITPVGVERQPADRQLGHEIRQPEIDAARAVDQTMVRLLNQPAFAARQIEEPELPERLSAIELMALQASEQRERFAGHDLAANGLEGERAAMPGQIEALLGAGATLVRALCQLALDRNADAFEEVRPPTLVRTDTDRDGLLDLFVARYVIWTPESDQFCGVPGERKRYCPPTRYRGERSRNHECRRFDDACDSDLLGGRGIPQLTQGRAIDQIEMAPDEGSEGCLITLTDEGAQQFNIVLSSIHLPILGCRQIAKSEDKNEICAGQGILPRMMGTNPVNRVNPVKITPVYRQD